MKYTVRITETIYDDYIIEANNEAEAINLIEDLYNRCEIVLAPGNLRHTSFNVLKRRKKQNGYFVH